jgi:hypothetical protein
MESVVRVKHCTRSSVRVRYVPTFSDKQPCAWERNRRNARRTSQKIPFEVMLDVMEFSLDKRDRSQSPSPSTPFGSSSTRVVFVDAHEAKVGSVQPCRSHWSSVVLVPSSTAARPTPSRSGTRSSPRHARPSAPAPGLLTSAGCWACRARTRRPLVAYSSSSISVTVPRPMRPTRRARAASLAPISGTSSSSCASIAVENMLCYAMLCYAMLC